jgi:hypothetical protein
MTRRTSSARIALAVVALSGLAFATSCDATVKSRPAPRHSACGLFTADDAHGQNTRYEARQGSVWWVTYGIVTNRCRGIVRIGTVSEGGPLAPGIDWLGRAEVRRAPVGTAPVNAFWANRLPPGAWVPANGAQVQEAERLQLVALIRVARSSPRSREPRVVPKASLTFIDQTGMSGQITLDPGLAFCDCPLPAGP